MPDRQQDNPGTQGYGFCIPESDLGRITGWAFVCSPKAWSLAPGHRLNQRINQEAKSE